MQPTSTAPLPQMFVACCSYDLQVNAWEVGLLFEKNGPAGDDNGEQVDLDPNSSETTPLGNGTNVTTENEHPADVHAADSLASRSAARRKENSERRAAARSIETSSRQGPMCNGNDFHIIHI